MTIDPELKKFVSNLRPVEMATCPTCGREHVTLYRHLSIKDTKQCIECWKEHRDSVPSAPEPVKKIVVVQGVLDQLVERVGELERQMTQVLEDLTALRKKRLRG